MSTTKTTTAIATPAPPRRRRLRLFVRIAAFFVVVVLGSAIWAKVEMDRIDREAERFADTGKGTIALLGEYQSALAKRDVDEALNCFDPEYANEREGLWVEQLQSERDGVRIYEWGLAEEKSFTRDDVVRQLGHYFSTVRSIEESHVKLGKIESIGESNEPVVRTVMWLRGTTIQGTAFECHVNFRMTLRLVNAAWKIHRQEMLDGETVTGGRTAFTDVTAPAGLDFKSHHNPLWQTEEWAPTKYPIMKYASAGVSAVDYDNDGWYDIFFCDAWKPRLYHNNGDGTFSDVTEAVGLPSEVPGCSVAIFADFNNSGYKDLFLGVATGPNRLFRNDGPGPDGSWHFTEVTEGAGLGGNWVAVAAAADYDNDGKLDLYLGRYLDPRKNVPTTLFYTRNSEGNTLLHNEGNYKFRDVTAQAGLRDGGLTLGIAWGDYNRDGWIDLFVANDFGRNALYRNNGDGTFTDVSKETGAQDFGYSMSAFLGDVNNDGALDIYVSKVHSGQRWYGHAPSMRKYMLTSFNEGTLKEDFEIYKEIYNQVGAEWHTYGDRVVSGNSLLLNDGKGHFRDVGAQARANPFGWYWSSAMFDYDNDGLQDIFAVNGWISGRTKEDL